MKEMTEERAEYLDELYTQTTPKVNGSKPGYFARKYPHKTVDNGEPVRIAPDILQWFRTHSSNAEQSINAVLRSAMV
jgi:uncharacterized protein (DUF4415 family)